VNLGVATNRVFDTPGPQSPDLSNVSREDGVRLGFQHVK
jgi:hypothetical protein